MNCAHFREAYSDFADGLLDEAAEIRMRLHVAECCACRRFDVAFRTGVDALRDLPVVPVSAGFGSRLTRRLTYEPETEGPALCQWSGAAGALLVVVTVALASWDVAARPGSDAGSGGSRARDPAVADALARAGAPPVTVRIAGDTSFSSSEPFNLFDAAGDSAPLFPGGASPFETPAIFVGR